MKFNLLAVAATVAVGLATPAGAEVIQGDMSPAKVAFGNGGGGASGIQVIGDFHIVHLDGFKSAPKRVGISVFNVAFRDEKTQSAKTSLTTKWNFVSALGTNMTKTVQQTKTATQHTALSGVDPATRQRITDAAYADFVGQLTAAGYDVVGPAELAKLAPEYATWTPKPNFSAGRFGTYVAPTGRNLFFLRSDGAKGDSQGDLSGVAMSFQGFDSPQAFQRSPYVAHDAKVGILAVTLVVDIGTYSNTGNTKRYNAKMEVGFHPGVTVQSGNFLATASLVEYWGLNSGGFPAVAILAAPLTSDLPFSNIDQGGGEVTVTADPTLFAAAAREVTHAANAKLVGVFASSAAR